MTQRLWLDVSNWKPVINGAQAKAQGMSAICAKITEGNGFIDDTAAGNYQQAMANGLDFLAYHFLDAGNGVSQAQFFVNQLFKATGRNPNGIPVCIDRESGSAQTADDFVRTLKSLLPLSPFCAYTAGWADASFGTSGQLATLPLWWSAYPTMNGGSPQSLLSGVTSGYFQPFGGFSHYVSRQYSSTASVANVPQCDVSVCWDDASYYTIFGPLGAPHPTQPVIPQEDAMFQNSEIRPVDSAHIGDASYAQEFNVPPANYGQYGQVWASFSCDGAPVNLRVFIHQQRNGFLNSPDKSTGAGYWYGLPVPGAPVAGYFLVNPDDNRLAVQLPSGIDKISVMRNDASIAPVSFMLEALHP